MNDATSRPSKPGSPQVQPGRPGNFRPTLHDAISNACRYLLELQHEDGFWCEDLEADETLQSDYILVHTLLGTFKENRIRNAANYILQRQNSDGGWGVRIGEPSEVSVSVRAYFALKLAGYKADHPALKRASQIIVRMGGVTEVDTLTKIYLCFFGQYDYDAVPAILPEIVLLPNWFWFNIYNISSWSRAILVPLSICYAKKPFKKISDDLGIEELFAGGRDLSHMYLHLDKKLISWRNFFLVLDRLIHWFERTRLRPLRSVALRRAESWMLQRFEMSDGLAAFFPSIMLSIIALRCLGYSVDDPQVIRALDELDKLTVEGKEILQVQPCKSPVWDSAHTLFALGEAGVPASDDRLAKCAEWILRKQVRNYGDWKVKNGRVQPSGWYFQFNNEFYPDMEDTSIVCLALGHVDDLDGRYQRESIERAINWVLSMQCQNGGWASLDKDNNQLVCRQFLFGDRRGMGDPPTADVTGRVLEVLAAYGYEKSQPAVKSALDFVRKEQRPDGAWDGARGGVSPIYATMLALRGLRATGVDHTEVFVQQAVQWLRAVQNPDGGWGMTHGLLTDLDAGRNESSTPSQTAWAVTALLATSDTTSDAVARGVAYLLQTQNKDGAWDEPRYSGTGFPWAFYLMFHKHQHYFPLIALATYEKTIATDEGV